MINILLRHFYLTVGTALSLTGRFLKTFGSWLCKTEENKEDGV